MISGGYVLYGGGDFAIEVATYLLDVALAKDSARRPGDGPAPPLVSDIVSQSPPRSADFEAVLGTLPDRHSSLATVRDIDHKQVVICVGDAHVRHRIYGELQALGVRLGTVIHPSASVSATAIIGEGSIICPFAFVGPFAAIGANCAINVSAIVGHDVVLGDSTVLSPGADVNGRAETGTAAFLGAGAIVNPKTRLGAYSKLSSGSVLNRQAGDGFLMHGNPAKGRQMMKLP